MANQLIQKLLEAEQEAELIVRRAKENQAKKHKEAQLSANEDIERFRAHEEEKFRQQYAEKYGKMDNSDLDEQLKLDIEQVKAQYKKHRDQALSMLIRHVVTADPTPSEAEKRLIRMRFAHKLIKPN